MKTREEYLEYQRNYYKENKEKQKEKQKEKREANHTEYKDYLKDYWIKNNKDLKVKRLSARLEDPLKTNLIQIKCRSKKIGVPFDLKKEDVEIPSVCPVFGVPLEFNVGRGYSGTGFSPSIDRIIPKLGYVKDNIQVISKKANIMKQDATPEELRMFAKWVLKTFPEESDGKA